VKPILLTYLPVPDITQWLVQHTQDQPPHWIVNFKTEQEDHLFWAIDKPEAIQEICSLFAQQLPEVYLADGHHRIAATQYFAQSQNLNKSHYFKILCAYFDASQLDILEFNRVVTLPPNLSTSALLSQLESLFHIAPLENPEKPKQKHELSLLLNNQWFRLQWKPNILEQYDTQAILLDTMLLNEQVLKAIIGIKNVQKDKRINYLEGPKGLEGLVQETQKGKNRAGFILYPTAIEDVIRVASLKKIMPPKSTWFEPRIKNGLIVYEY
jgi:uncharacterized protein (DUF1015 family)